MHQRAYLSTRKGLFELARDGGRWQLGPVHFLGEPVTMALPDRRDGSAKLRASAAAARIPGCF